MEGLKASFLLNLLSASSSEGLGMFIRLNSGLRGHLPFPFPSPGSSISVPYTGTPRRLSLPPCP